MAECGRGELADVLGCYGQTGLKAAWAPGEASAVRRSNMYHKVSKVKRET